jgi:hypothetical protein
MINIHETACHRNYIWGIFKYRLSFISLHVQFKAGTIQRSYSADVFFMRTQAMH